MIGKVKTFIFDDSGASLVEYALLVGLVAVAAIAAMTTLSGGITEAFETTEQKLKSAHGDEKDGGDDG